MRAKLVVFPITGTNWCFSRSIKDSIASSNLGSAFTNTFHTKRALAQHLLQTQTLQILVDSVSLKVLFFFFFSLFLLLDSLVMAKILTFAFFLFGFFWKGWIELGLVRKKHLKELSRTRFISELSLLIHLVLELGVFTFSCYSTIWATQASVHNHPL
jgi:hypothetical protein